MSEAKPIIGITMGDPAGIGPEIASKVMAKQYVYDICRPFVVGDAAVMSDAVGITKTGLMINPIYDVKDARFEYGTLDIFDLKLVDMTKLKKGEVSAMAGTAAFRSVEKVIKLAMAKEIDATVTGPLNKEAMNLAGFHFSGHTEIYAHFTGTKNYSMMLACDDFRVVHVSTHVSLRQACDLVKKDRVFQVIKLADSACKRIGIAGPRIGVAGLNPHSGLNSFIGEEEVNEIIPAIGMAKELGINVEGPMSPDALYACARDGKYDIVVAMYHDQGHIPLKVEGFSWNEEEKKWNAVRGVNITLGLPIIRVSVDHGTAFPEAGKGTANEESLLNSVEYAVKLASSSNG